jgi:hypothetical protein
MSLREFASKEICLSGMAGEAWNESGLSHRIMELIVEFASYGHSGGSAFATLSILEGLGYKGALERPMSLSQGPVEGVVALFKRQDYKRPEDAEFAFTRFLHLARWRPLGPGGDLDPATFAPSVEFAVDVSEHFDRGAKSTIFQSSRKATVFSEDSGKTWYDIDNPNWSYPKDCTPYRRPNRPEFSG